MNESILTETRHWLERAVIGLNLCPFAKAVQVRQQVRFVVSEATTLQQLHASLLSEIEYLLAENPADVETTLLIHPHVLQNFLDFNDFLDVADALLVEQQAEGILQIASFHPQYQFFGTRPDDIENYTNRSPYPILHLLREASIERVLETYPDPDDIPERNIQTLQRLGIDGWKRLLTVSG